MMRKRSVAMWLCALLILTSCLSAAVAGGDVCVDHDWSYIYTYDGEDKHSCPCENEGCTARDIENCDYESATCEAPAKCLICSHSKGSALGHDWEAWEYIGNDEHESPCGRCGENRSGSCQYSEATCTENQKCGTCKHEKTNSALGHNIVEDAAVEPTCTGTGLTAGEHCTRCDDVTVAQTVVKKLRHHMVTDAAVEPTCVKTGLTEGGHCSRCGKVTIKQTVVKKLGHDIVTDAAVRPSCIKAGLTKGKHCARCGEVTDAQTVIKKLGHDMVKDAAVEPTCVSDGLTEGEHCARCRKVSVAQTVVEKLGHDLVTDAAVAPTCTSTGLTKGEHCARCGEVTIRQTVVEELGHDLATDAAVEPTCTSTGLTAGEHCARCGEVTVAQTVIEKLGHDIVKDAAVAPTCTSTGLTEGEHCARCGEVTVAQTVVDMLAHDFQGDVCASCGLEKPAEAVADSLPFLVLDESEQPKPYEMSPEAAEDKSILRVAAAPEPDGSHATRLLQLNASALDALRQQDVDTLHFTLGDATLSIPLAAVDKDHIAAALEALDGEWDDATLAFALIVTPDGEGGFVYRYAITLVLGDQTVDVTALFQDVKML